MSSAYYASQINKCNEIIGKIGNLYGSIDGINKQAKSCQEILNKNVMNGESMGAVEMENIFATLESVRLALNTVVAACVAKRDEFERLLQEALAREAAALAEKNKLETN